MDRLFFIVNPVAGAGRTKEGFERVCAELDRRGLDYGFEYTRYKGHATELARQALEAGEGCIISAGGDGTANEVAAALANSPAVMGLLPLGTGNDLAKALRIPTDPMEALSLILEGAPRPMDVGMANDRLFLNVAGFGFDVDVLVNTDEFKKRFRGMLPYLMGIVKALAGLRSLRVTLKDGERTWTQEVTIVSIGNGTHFGGGMNVTPFADPFDGLLDISVVNRVSKPLFLKLLPLFIKGGHTERKEVEYFRARELYVECDAPCMLNCDGEVGSSMPARFRILPGAVNMLVKRGADE